MKIKILTTKDHKNINIGKFTVLVGPNNVGKSQTLQDIYSKMAKGINAKTTIIRNIEFEKPSKFEDLIKGLDVLEDSQNITQHLIRGLQSDLVSGSTIAVNLDDYKKQFESEPNLNFTLGNIAKFKVSFLDASSRLVIAQSAPSYNLYDSQQPPQNLLQLLFKGGSDIENKLRKAFKDAFGMDILLDYGGMTRLNLRVAKKFKNIPKDPREAAPIFNEYNQLDVQGDGFRSFVGVILGLLLSEGRVILLDEPEAFLHPAQARALGKWIADYTQKAPIQIIVATHNAHFLSGILSSRLNVDVCRLNRAEDHTTYNYIAAEATTKLAKSPLLSSQRVLESIFHKGVVVCEADADRCIYQTVATREFKNQNILFIHAHNKQSIGKVIPLLKKASIPVCAITDIDIMDSESDFKNLFKALTDDNVPDDVLEMRKKIAMAVENISEKVTLEKLKENVSQFSKQLGKNEHSLSGARGALNRIRKRLSKWSDIKNFGIRGIPKQKRKIAKELINKAKECGLFIVPVGELEGWIDVGTRQKNKWIVLALEALHENRCGDELKGFIKEILDKINNES